MIGFVTNRIKDGDDWLGENFNDGTGTNLLVGTITDNDRYDIWDDKKVGKDENPPSFKLFKMLEEDSKPCLTFIHGYNQSPKDHIEKCKELQQFGVNVLIFSWPSNPGPHYWPFEEYPRARRNARMSIIALDRFFNRLNDYRERVGEFKRIRALMAYSQGSYLLENYIKSIESDHQLDFADNIMLLQADVRSKNHHYWADFLTETSNVYATINTTDDIIDLADFFSGEDKLGNTLKNLDSDKITYLNFGKTGIFLNSHRLWAVDYAPTNKIFKQCFQGLDVDISKLNYNRKRNYYQIPHP